jgi:hypothetical protein
MQERQQGLAHLMQPQQQPQPQQPLARLARLKQREAR